MVRRLTLTLAVTPTLPRALTLSLTPPRYAAAASGPKDVVLVIDTSGSMAGDNIAMAKVAAKMVIDTLTAVDYVTIVKYHFAKWAGAEVAYSSALVEATDANKDQLKTWIDRIGAQGGGVWKQVFTTAFEVMDATTASSNCNRIMFFLSDGGQPSSWTDDDSDGSGARRHRTTPLCTCSPTASGWMQKRTTSRPSRARVMASTTRSDRARSQTRWPRTSRYG